MIMKIIMVSFALSSQPSSSLMQIVTDIYIYKKPVSIAVARRKDVTEYLLCLFKVEKKQSNTILIIYFFLS